MVEKLIHLIFSKVAKYPEELRIEDFSIQDEDGKYVKTANAPRQLFFVPNKELSFSTSKHDFRDDLLSIKSGTLLYEVYALSSEDKDSFNDYKIDDIKGRVEKATKIGELKATSEFKASEFGDVGIFFRHQAKVNEEESLK